MIIMIINERNEYMQETQHAKHTITEQHKTNKQKQHECKMLQNIIELDMIDIGQI